MDERDLTEAGCYPANRKLCKCRAWAGPFLCVRQNEASNATERIPFAWCIVI